MKILKWILICILTGIFVLGVPVVVWNGITLFFPVNCEKDRGYGLPNKYYDDSPCFDTNYRCQVECSNFGRNFTGKMDGCACDCGDAFVSMCSGFMRMKEAEDNAFYYNKTVTCPAYDEEGNPSSLCEEK